MDSNNGRPPQSDQPPPMDGGDWRTQLQQESRQRIVDKIMETLKRHLPFSGPEGLQELRKIAVKFEEKIYSASTSQSDYLRKISLKMLTMESKSQNTLPLPSTSGGGGVSRNSQDPVPAQNMQSQVHNQGQSVPLPMVPNQPQARQQLLPQKNIQNNLASSPAVSGLTQNPMSNITQNQNPQNTSSISQNSMGMLTNAQRPMQGRQQHMQPQQSQTPEQYMYSQQLQNHVMKQKLQSGNIQQSLGQTPLQQQQQNLLQHQQSVLRQQQQQNPSQPTSVAQQPQTQMSQQPLMPSQQQPNSVNMQQSQMIGQQSNISDMQQQRLLGQQNGVPNLPSQQQNNHQNLQQQLMGQQGNISNTHQQQLSRQAINGGLQQLQQQMQSGNSSMQTNQHSVHPMQQPKVVMQQSQLQSQQRLMPQLQTQLPQVQLHNMQQRIQNSNPLLQQQQGMTDQQKQLLQSQRAPQEAPSTSSDSTAQTGGGIANAGDWKEDVYQRIKVMKDSYLVELSEMYHKISMRLQQNESLPQQPKAEQLEKLRIFKTMLEKLIAFIQVQKNNVTPSHRDKLPSFEKQIVSLLHSQNRPRKPGPSMQQSQMLSQSQFSQGQSLDGGAHPPLHSTIMQGSIASLHQNNVSNLQHSSVPSNIDSGQGNALSSMQQVATESRQQNPASVPQQGNMASLQQNVNPQSNPNMLQNRHLKQHQDQMFQAQQLTHLQSRQLQQHILQKQLQQTKQQQATQMSQLGQMNDANELQMSQGLRSRSNGFPQHLTSAQCYEQQLKPGLETVSPQINQHSSPQIDEQNTQSANSPFVPSPSTPLASSLMPGEYEKPSVSSLTNTAKLGHQQINGPPTVPQPLSIGTLGMLASPLLKCPGADATHANATTTVSGKSIVTEQPIERLLKAVKSISPKALKASVSDIGSVVSMIDRIAGSAPGNGSRATVGEDLVAMTNCRLQARSSLTQDGNIGIKRIRRYTSAMPSYDDSLEQFTGFEMSEFESTSTSSIKKAKIEINHALVEEIREINDRLIDTVVDITDEDVDPLVATIGSEGTVIKCCFSAVSLSPNFKSQYTSALMSPIQPLRLLVPVNYPSCSPILLDKLPVEVRKEYGDLSVKAKSRFNICLRSLSQPMSLREIARTWDNCARAVISEYAHHNGGGTFTSKYGATWESCSTAA